jgi:hypothetical protein
MLKEMKRRNFFENDALMKSRLAGLSLYTKIALYHLLCSTKASE